MKHTSRIELSRSALRQNLDFIRKSNNGTRFFSVVKGNAYGHGIEEFVTMLMGEGITDLTVFDASEAYRVRQTCEHCNVVIMGYIDHEDLKWAIENDVQFYIFDLERLKKAISIAQKINKPAHIHLEVETGFNRTGLIDGTLEEAVALIKKHPKELVFEGLCTHYAGAESMSNYLRVNQQIENYNKIRRWVASFEIQPKLYHTACSAASLAYQDTRMDMVRIGILQYGFWPSQEMNIYYLSQNPENRNPLKRVMSWKTQVMAVKDVPAGEYIGYGSNYLTSEDSKIAIIPVGYAYGYSRSLSNLGRVLINGKRMAVVGLVNMNMIAVNINHAPDTKPGDEVVLIGEQGDLSISVASFGEMSNLLNYELLTRLPEKIPRTIVD